MRVLCTAPYFRPVPDRYADLFRRHGIEYDNPFVAQNMSEADLLAIIERYDGVIAGDDEFTARVIEKGARARLKVIAKWGVGINAIDTVAAERHGVAVRRSPRLLSDAVADAALGYILMLARQFHVSDSRVRAGEWVKIAGIGLRGRTLGIIGVGDIGRQIALRAAPFGLKLLGNDIRPIEEPFLASSGMRMVSKQELLEGSDFVALACDLNPTSHHILAASDFARFRPKAMLVNIARGGLVDTAALVQALRDGQLAGAALDVYEEEPLPADSALRGFDNVLLNAHNAFNTDSSVAAVSDNTVRQLLLVLKPDAAADLDSH